MKIVFAFFSFVIGLLLMSSCSMPEYAYLNDAQRDSVQTIISDYTSTIHVGDQLYVYVYSQQAEVAAPFNQETHTFRYDISLNNSASSKELYESVRQTPTAQINGYEVSEEGCIIFPILGKLHVEGITLDSLSHRIENRLISEGYVKDPQVTVSLMNMRVSVIGEVNRPHELHVSGERLTIFEALAMCGDMTMYGCRDNVVVMRELEGKLTLIPINLTTKEAFDSDVYYLKSNDIVYVEPNRVRKKMATPNKQIPTYTSLLVSLVMLARRISNITVIY